VVPDRIAELQAAPHWRSADLISDLHLQAAEPATAAAWRRLLLEDAGADAVFILGDLFEAWPGDDVITQPGFEADGAQVLREAARRRPVFLMHGNRDFLFGPDLCAATGVRLLDDPTVFVFGATRWLLSHGDALCLADTDYLEFRAQARDPQWQRAILARPLAERQALARSIRSESEDRKRGGANYADVDQGEARAWLRAAAAATLVHGHTHKPAEHDLGDGLRRIVLSDWDLAAQPPRAEVLRLGADGSARRVPLA
jgi:UDP-2,3-diacylglucosamine hydrolase